MDKLITSAQNLTASWADLGDPISTANVKKLALWLNVDINDSLNVRFRAVPQKTSNKGADGYNFAIRYTSSSAINIGDQYFELTDDADQKILVAMETDGLIPFVQIQVQAGTAGATPGQIDEAEISKI